MKLTGGVETVIDKFQFYDKIGGLSKWKLIEIELPTSSKSYEITCNDHLWRNFYGLEMAKDRFIKLKQAFSSKIG